MASLSVARKIMPGKLRGMNEHSASVTVLPVYSDQKTICQRVFEAANVASIPSTDSKTLRFAGQTLSSKSLALVNIKMLSENEVNISVNCEKMVIGSMLLNEIKTYLRN